MGSAGWHYAYNHFKNFGGGMATSAKDQLLEDVWSIFHP